jgi:hypothetical protein
MTGLQDGSHGVARQFSVEGAAASSGSVEDSSSRGSRGLWRWSELPADRRAVADVWSPGRLGSQLEQRRSTDRRPETGPGWRGVRHSGELGAWEAAMALWPATGEASWERQSRTEQEGGRRRAGAWE